MRAASVEMTFYGETSDLLISGSDASYATARDTSTSSSSSAHYSRLGQKHSTTSGDYSVYRLYFDFDTSSITDTWTVESAVLHLCAKSDASTDDFDVKIYRYDWQEPGATYREANYDGAYGGDATLEGTLLNSSAFAADTYFTLTVATGAISVTGDTKYTVVSGEDVNNSAPASNTNEYISMWMADEELTTKDPKLVVVVSAPATPTPTATNTITPTATNTVTPTATSTPTGTPYPCPIHITSDTTWGPGTVLVGCNVGITSGVTLTLAAGTELRMTNDWMLDVKGKLYAVGTAANPITITHHTMTATGSYDYIFLRGDNSVLDYVNVCYGDGINVADESTITHVKAMSNTHGLYFSGPWVSHVQSSTLQYNDYGMVLWMDALPYITDTNVLSNTVWDVAMYQHESLSTDNCWWGSDPPDEGKVWDFDDEFTLGDVSWAYYASAWISW